MPASPQVPMSSSSGRSSPGARLKHLAHARPAPPHQPCATPPHRCAPARLPARRPAPEHCAAGRTRRQVAPGPAGAAGRARLVVPLQRGVGQHAELPLRQIAPGLRVRRKLRQAQRADHGLRGRHLRRSTRGIPRCTKAHQDVQRSCGPWPPPVGAANASRAASCPAVCGILRPGELRCDATTAERRATVGSAQRLLRHERQGQGTARGYKQAMGC